MTATITVESKPVATTSNPASRASELMQIADGTKTAAEIASASTERSKKHRALSPLRNGENAGDPEASAKNMKRQLVALDDEPDSDIEDEIEPETAAPAKSTTTKAKSRPAQWLAAATAAAEALRELQDLQSEYADWRDSLPENLQEGSATSEKLDGVCDLDIASALSTAEEAEGLDLPLGFGRD